jgi:hypothetical protein
MLSGRGDARGIENGRRRGDGKDDVGMGDGEEQVNEMRRREE